MTLSPHQIQCLKTALRLIHEVLSDNDGEVINLVNWVETVAKHEMYIHEDIRTPSRREEIAWCRFIVFYISHNEFKVPLKVTEKVYKLTIDNIEYGIRAVKTRMETDKSFLALVWKVKSGVQAINREHVDSLIKRLQDDRSTEQVPDNIGPV